MPTSPAMRLRRGSRLVLASHNAGKLREIAALMDPYGITMVSAGDLGLSEPDETAPDFAGNARLKSLAAAQRSGLPALADDSGFCCAALGGAPGLHSARWAGPGRDFAAAMARVARESAGSDDRRAWFVCVLCLAWPDEQTSYEHALNETTPSGPTASFLGRVEGTLTIPPRGSAGFGYDPMFTPAGHSLTYGEMHPSLKHADSHRARAMAQFAAACLPLPA